jgi:hypothetical protein
MLNANALASAVANMVALLSPSNVAASREPKFDTKDDVTLASIAEFALAVV